MSRLQNLLARCLMFAKQLNFCKKNPLTLAKKPKVLSLTTSKYHVRASKRRKKGSSSSRRQVTGDRSDMPKSET